MLFFIKVGSLWENLLCLWVVLLWFIEMKIFICLVVRRIVEWICLLYSVIMLILRFVWFWWLRYLWCVNWFDFVCLMIECFLFCMMVEWLNILKKVRMWRWCVSLLCGLRIFRGCILVLWNKIREWLLLVGW